MRIKEILTKALTMSNEWKFFVKIDYEEIKEMSYLELGILITSNVEEIEVIHIKMRE